MPSSNLGIPFVSTSQSQKELTINDAIESLDKAGNKALEVVITGNRTLTPAEFTGNVIFTLTGAMGAAFELTIPTTPRLFAVRNASGADCDVRYVGGGAVTLLNGEAALYHSDGTTIVGLGGGAGGGGGGSGIGEAPIDGNEYVRKDAAWVQPTGAVDVLARAGATRFVVRGTRNNPVNFTDNKNIVCLDDPGPDTNSAYANLSGGKLVGSTELSTFMLYESQGLPASNDAWMFVLSNEWFNFNYLITLTLTSTGALKVFRNNNYTTAFESAAGVIGATGIYNIVVVSSLLNGGAIKVYVNNVEVIATTRTEAAEFDQEVGMYLGGESNGRISRPCVWNTLLTPDDINNLYLYSNPRYVKEDNIGAYWPMIIQQDSPVPGWYGDHMMWLSPFSWDIMVIPDEPVRSGNFVRVGTAGAGEFFGYSNFLALATSPTTFDFIAPELGWQVYDQELGTEYTWNGAAWVEVAAGGGGTVGALDDGVTVVAAASAFNFTGVGVAVTDAGSGQASVSVPGTTARKDGTPVLAGATNLNFTGAGVSLADAGGGQVNIAIPGGSGIATQDEGTPVNTATTLNFVGAGVSVTDPGAGVATVNIPGVQTQVELGTFLGGLQLENAMVFKHLFAKATDFPDDFAGSALKADDAATGAVAYTIRKNGANIGSITVAASGTSGTFATSGGAVSFAQGDTLELITPSTADATLANVSITLLGTRAPV